MQTCGDTARRRLLRAAMAEEGRSYWLYTIAFTEWGGLRHQPVVAHCGWPPAMTAGYRGQTAPQPAETSAACHSSRHVGLYHHVGDRKINLSRAAGKRDAGCQSARLPSLTWQTFDRRPLRKDVLQRFSERLIRFIHFVIAGNHLSAARKDRSFAAVQLPDTWWRMCPARSAMARCTCLASGSPRWLTKAILGV
ncbi:MAG: hypothetical protein RIS79_2507 [Verrucomicrobiota bacterium]